jgi:hypothetical protein
VRLDQIDDAGFDVRPDGVVLQVGHVRHGHLHGQIKGLGGRGVDDAHRPASGEETSDLLRRAHGR